MCVDEGICKHVCVAAECSFAESSNQVVMMQATVSYKHICVAANNHSAESSSDLVVMVTSGNTSTYAWQQKTIRLRQQWV
jgi:hypothetical protein